MTLEKSPQEPTQKAKLPEETRSVGSSALWGTLAKVVSVAVNFLLGVIIARALGADGKGMYAFIQQAVGVLVVLFGLGLTTSNIYFVASKKVSPKHATANTLYLGVVVSAVAAIIFYLFLQGPFAPSPPYSGEIVLLAIALFLTTTMYSWLLAIGIGLDGLRVQALSTIVSLIPTTIAAFVLWRLGLFSVVTMLWVAIAVQAIASLAVLALEPRRMLSLKPNLASLKTMFSYSFKSYIVNLVGYLHLRQDVLILGWLAPLDAIGVYSVAVGFAEIVRYLPTILNNALFARISRPDIQSGLKVSAMASRLVVVFVGVLALVFALIAPAAIPFLYGTGFVQSSALFLTLLPGTIALSLTESASAYLFSQEVIYWKFSTAAVVINITLNLIFIPIGGVVAAAICSSATYTLFSIGVMWLALKHSGASLSDFLVPRKEDFTTLKRALLSRRNGAHEAK